MTNHQMPLTARPTCHLRNRLVEAVFEAAPFPLLRHIVMPESGEKLTIAEQSSCLLQFDSGVPKIDIPSWEYFAGSGRAMTPESEYGYQQGYHTSHANIETGMPVHRVNKYPIGFPGYNPTEYPGFGWYRQIMEIPSSWDGKPIVLMLGGEDHYDWQDYWVYLNGQRIGHVSRQGAWRDTPRYLLTPTDEIYGAIKFGQSNLLAVQTRGLDFRQPDMNIADLERFSGESFLVDQYIAQGEPIAFAKSFEFLEDSFVSEESELSFKIKSLDLPIELEVTYWLEEGEATLCKRICVHNYGNKPLTLLELELLNGAVSRTFTS